MNQTKSPLIILLAALAVAVASQLLYGHLGFNPTDEGFVQAMSRRLLEGQVPHRDFISIRPVLSALLHLPEVAWGGEYTFYLGRLVARLQFVIIVFVWMMMGIEHSQRLRNLDWPGKVALSVLVYILCTYYYNLTAWHTIDGIFLLSVGLWMALKPKRGLQLVGYFVLGLACLAKQNFLPVPFLVWLLYKPMRDPLAILFILLPPIIYVSLLIYWDAWNNFVVQMTSETSLLQAGFLTYLTSAFFWAGAITGGMVAFIQNKSRPNKILMWVFPFISGILFATMAMSKYELKPAYLVFGFICGILPLHLLRYGFGGNRCLGIAAAGIAWAASVSVGFNTPVLFVGVLMLLIWLLLNDAEKSSQSGAHRFMLPVLAVIGLFVYHHAHRQYIYRDKPAQELNYDLSGKLAGAKNFYTNKVTYLFTSELDSLSKKFTKEGAAYAVVPEFPAWWVQAQQVNPLSADWPAGLELQNPKLLQRVKNELDQLPAGSVVLVQKYRASSLAEELVPIKQHAGNFPIVAHLEKNFTKTGESIYWEVWEKDQ